MANTCRLTLSAALSAGLLAALLEPASAAKLGQAVVTQKVNQVTVAQNAAATFGPVATGAVVKDENVVRTGIQSRAELEFTDKTIARLGATTTFSFDIDSSTLDFKQGSVLFSKPKGSGPLQIRTAAVTAAITGTTGFVSTVPAGKVKKKKGTPDEDVVMFGIIEGSLKGKSSWVDENGKSHDFRFALGPGEMLVSEPGTLPSVVQFDLAKFVATSPLIHGFSSTLPNNAQIAQQVSNYNSLVSRGFIDPGNAVVATMNNQLMFVGSSKEPATTRFEPGVQQLQAISTMQNQRPTVVAPREQPQMVMMLASVAPPKPPGGGFVDVGANGEIRGQLTWRTDADLDMHLVLPDNQELYYGSPNKTVTFNNGAAMAKLDADNVGRIINVQPDKRVENIVISGLPSSGNYQFYVHSFGTSHDSDSGTLVVTKNGGKTTQTLNFTLARGQDTTRLIITK